MRFSSGFLTAILLLFGFAGECQAQNLTGGFPTLTAGGRDLDSLKAAFNSAPKLVIKPAGSEAFYDVAIENICDGPSIAWPEIGRITNLVAVSRPSGADNRVGGIA
jgi:hypothetical protein